MSPSASLAPAPTSSPTAQQKERMDAQAKGGGGHRADPDRPFALVCRDHQRHQKPDCGRG
jgi:hypothetical protein